MLNDHLCFLLKVFGQHRLSQEQHHNFQYCETCLKKISHSELWLLEINIIRMRYHMLITNKCSTSLKGFRH